MTENSPAHGAKERKGLSWQFAPFKAAKALALQASFVAKQSYPACMVVWCEMQESAQNAKAGGEFRISRPHLALLCGTDLAGIDAILSAFGEVGLIVDGKCATFVQTRSQKSRENERSSDAKSKAPNAPRRPRPDARAPLLDDIGAGARLETAASAARPLRDASRPICDTATPEIDPSASQFRTESSESSSTTLDLIEDPPSSSSGEAAGAKTTTDGEIFSKIVEAVDGKIPELVIRRGVESVRKWIEAGYDLEGDILPELAEIAEKSTLPLRTFQAKFVGEQIAGRHAKRIAGEAAGAKAPGLTTAAEAAFSRGPPNGRTSSEDPMRDAERRLLGNG